jgi:hypothetical protein
MPFKTLIMSILCCYLTGIHLVCFLYIFLDNLFFEISTLVCDCSCVPLHNFDYVYDYLMETNLSFIDWYVTFAPLRYNSNSYICRTFFTFSISILIIQ